MGHSITKVTLLLFIGVGLPAVDVLQSSRSRRRTDASWYRQHLSSCYRSARWCPPVVDSWSSREYRRQTTAEILPVCSIQMLWWWWWWLTIA